MKTIILMTAIFLLFPLTLKAQGFGLSDAIKTKDGITYRCTGIGESKHDPRNAEFPLKIVFATDTSALYSDVTVRIDGEDGKKVFEVFCDGAWLLVKVSPGRYRVSASDSRKISRSANATVGSSQTQVTLRWPD